MIIFTLGCRNDSNLKFRNQIQLFPV